MNRTKEKVGIYKMRILIKQSLVAVERERERERERVSSLIDKKISLNIEEKSMVFYAV